MAEWIGVPVVPSANDAPLVSVLTPSFNQGAFIGDTLASVQAQTYQNVEHIVMDGGSTDQTLERLRSAGPKVKWSSEPDEGQTDALNKAFALSTGEIIGWLNSDDAYYDVKAIESVVEYFSAHPNVDVVYGHAARIDASGRVFRILWVPRFSYRHLRWQSFIVQPAAFVRRRAIEDHFLDASFHFAMDWELWLRLAQERRFARIDRVIAVDRVHEDRKILTWLPVLRADTEVLAERFGVHVPKQWPWIHRYHFLTGRIASVLPILLQNDPLAFSGEQDSKAALVKRAIWSRASSWPEGYV